MSLRSIVITAFTALAVACAPTLRPAQLLDRAKFLNDLHLNTALRKQHKVCKIPRNRKHKFCLQDRKDLEAELEGNLSGAEKLQGKVLGMSEKEYEHFKLVVHWSRKYSNIRNFHRYSTNLLTESVLNLQRPGYKGDKPLMLAFMSPWDYSNFGVRALDVKSHELGNFTKGYKVILFETENKQQMKQQLEMVRRLYQGRNQVAIMTIGAHGLQKKMALSGQKKDEQMLTVNDLGPLFSPYDSLFKSDAIVFLASCRNGQGREKEVNIANQMGHALPGRTVISCDTDLINFRYKLEFFSGKYRPGTVQMIGFDGSMIRDCLYEVRVPRKKQKIRRVNQQYRRNRPQQPQRRFYRHR